MCFYSVGLLIRSTHHLRQILYLAWIQLFSYVYITSFYPSLPFSGRVRYKFASFWNRNHALRGLQRAAKNYRTMLEAEKKVYPWIVSFVIFCYYICQLNFYFFKLAWCIMQNKMGTIFWNSWDSAKDTSLLAILWNSNSSSDSKPFICCAHGLCTTVSLFLFLIFGLETSFRNCLFYTLLCILGMDFPVPLLLFIHTSV
jgi:hypothetical protein